VLIGIDASTTATGFALGGPSDGSPRGGVWKLPGAEDLILDRSLAMAAQSVSDLCRMMKAEWVYIEAPLILVNSQHAAHTTSALIQLTGAVRAAATRAGAQVRLAAVSTVRKHFIGRGDLKKLEAKAAVMERCRMLGWDHGGSNDRADSMAVWAFGMARQYPTWAPKGTPLFAEARGRA
jgi:Holliday junction resolvasome RuvABC endonuclease subunit